MMGVMMMARWNDTCVLVERAKGYLDDEGVEHAHNIKREVFCNSYTLSTQAWATARLADYTADDEIQLRTIDYNSEQDVVYKGKAFSVMHVMVQGDLTRLILKQYDHDIGDELDEEGDTHTPPEDTEEPDIEDDVDWMEDWDA